MPEKGKATACMIQFTICTICCIDGFSHLWWIALSD